MYRRALELQPEDAATLFNYAGLLEDGKGNETAALELYRRASLVCPSHVPSLLSYGRLAMDLQNNTDEAQQALEAALEVRQSQLFGLCWWLESQLRK